MIPVVTQATIEAFINEKPDQVMELLQDQPDLAHFLRIGCEQFMQTWGEEAAASAASFACMVYVLLKRQSESE